MGENGKQWRPGETRPREGGHTIQERETRREMGDNGRRHGETRPWEGGHTIVGSQWETRGGQDLGKADTPSNTGTHVGRDNGRQWQTRRDQRRQTYHHRHTCGETMGDKKGRQDVGKADAPSNTGTPVWRQYGRQGETRPREGGHTVQHRQTRQDLIQHRHTCGETMGDRKGRQDVEKAGAPSNTGTRVGRQWETMGLMGEKGRQDLGKADAPSNTGTHAGRQWETLGDKGETRHREGKHIIQHRHTCGETTGDKWRQGPGRRTHQPTRRETGRQRETR